MALSVNLKKTFSQKIMSVFFKVKSRTIHDTGILYEEFIDAGRKALRRSGGGPSWWRYEHLQSLLEMTCVVTFCT